MQAAWGNELSDEQIRQQAKIYFQTRSDFKGKEFDDAFHELFPETDEIPPLNHKLRLFIFAEEIPLSVARVCRFLRTSYGVDVNCIAISTFATDPGERIANTEVKVGEEDAVAKKHSASGRWSEDKPVKQVVREAVEQLTKENRNLVFAPKDGAVMILKEYPSFNRNTITSQVVQLHQR